MQRQRSLGRVVVGQVAVEPPILFPEVSMLRPILLVLGISAALGAAQAADSTATTARQGGHHFAQLDTNGDGKVTQDEFLAAAAQRFDTLDTSHRGALDVTDLAAAPDVVSRDDRRAEHIAKRLDGNGDGNVDAAEAKAGTDRLFDRLDRNKDGILTADEMKAGHGGRHGRFEDFMQQRLTALDTNHDGNISRVEFEAGAQARFAAADANHDGVLSTAEMADSPRVLENNQQFAEWKLKAMDANGDGQVSRDEYLASARQRFTQMDRNGDGVLTADDRPAHRMAKGTSASEKN
jgi:Ca2+-binding EF-hand superfamily protein